METSGDRVAAGHAIYTPASLRFYDLVVHGLSNRFLWRCPTHELQQLYDRNLSARHVDIGVGTGMFLARAQWPVANPEIALVDLNPHCLERAARRIAPLVPQRIGANVLEPLPASLGRGFASVGLMYLLHCVPGTITEKAVVFDHLKPHLAPGARVFGATIVQGEAPRNRAARKLMDIYNARGVFSNAQDRAEDLAAALASRFERANVRLIGCVALFEAQLAG